MDVTADQYKEEMASQGDLVLFVGSASNDRGYDGEHSGVLVVRNENADAFERVKDVETVVFNGEYGGMVRGIVSSNPSSRVMIHNIP